MFIYMYTHIFKYIYICVYIYIFIHIYRAIVSADVGMTMTTEEVEQYTGNNPYLSSYHHIVIAFVTVLSLPLVLFHTMEIKV
jgi:hypothetical protein